MSEKDEDHARKELILEERHSREMAKKSKTLADEMAQQPQTEGGKFGANERGDVVVGTSNARSSKVRHGHESPERYLEFGCS